MQSDQWPTSVVARLWPCRAFTISRGQGPRRPARGAVTSCSSQRRSFLVGHVCHDVSNLAITSEHRGSDRLHLEVRRTPEPITITIDAATAARLAKASPSLTPEIHEAIRALTN